MRSAAVQPSESRSDRGLAVELRGHLGVFERRLRLPATRHRARPALPLDEERAGHARGGMVEVAPALAPDGGALLPAQAVAREQHLERLGEARLARAVAPDDERQARPRPQLQRLRRPDAAEPLDGDRSQEGTRPRRRGRGRREARRSAARQLRFERLAALERRQHQAAPRLIEAAVGLEARRDEVPDTGVHELGRVSGGSLDSVSPGRRVPGPPEANARRRRPRAGSTGPSGPTPASGRPAP